MFTVFRRRRPAGGVNLLHLRSGSYKEIQNQIYGLVREQLPPDRVSETMNKPVRGALNFVLHIRMGKDRWQYAPPAEVFMSHGLADKSYYFVRDLRSGLPLVNSFQHVLVPGEWHRRRLLEAARHSDPTRRIHLGEDQIHIVGWPRLDPLVQAGAAVRAPVSGRPLRLCGRRRTTTSASVPSSACSRRTPPSSSTCRSSRSPSTCGCPCTRPTGRTRRRPPTH